MQVWLLKLRGGEMQKAARNSSGFCVGRIGRGVGPTMRLVLLCGLNLGPHVVGSRIREACRKVYEFRS